MGVNYLTRCEQDLVGFNFNNSGYPLQIGVPTLVNDALVIDTNATVPYAGTVNLSISNFLGMTATFASTGTTSLTVTVTAGQKLYIPLMVTAVDCGYDRGYYWEFRIWYTSTPDYSADDGGVDPTPCAKPNRSVCVCRWDARWQNKCLAAWQQDLYNVTGIGTKTLRFLLNQSPQCTGPVRVEFTTPCVGLSFSMVQPVCNLIITRETDIPTANGDANGLIYINTTNEVWTLDSANDKVIRVNATTNVQLPSINLTAGDNPQGLIYFNGYNKVYVSATGNNDVRVIDTGSLAITGITGSVGVQPDRFTWVNYVGVNEGWVTCNGSDEVYRIDVATDTVLGSAIPTNSNPRDIMYVPSRQEAWVACNGGDTVIINVLTYSPGSISTGGVYQFAQSPTEIWATASTQIIRFDIVTLAQTIVAVANSTGIVYLSGDGYLVLDGTADQMNLFNEDVPTAIIHTYSTGSNPRDIVVIPTKNKIFVTDVASGDITPYTIRQCANPTYNRVTSGNLIVDLDNSYALNYVDINVDYDTANINCFCQIKAAVTYENSLPNPNLLTFGNNGTFNGYSTQALFNAAGVLARNSTVFTMTTGISGSALRTQITSPPDYFNRPNPTPAVNPDATHGSIIWQGDINFPIGLLPNTLYWMRGKVRINSAVPLIRANEEVHIDKFHVVGGAPTQNVAVPFMTQYTPTGVYLDNGIRFKSAALSKITPFVRYVNTLASLSYTTLIGDLYLSDGAFTDWCDIVLTRYYPADPITCPDKYVTFKNSMCEYNTHLQVDYEDNCIEVAFTDHSDFGYEPGHDQSDFTIFRQVTVTLPDGTQQILSSVPPYNILITPAASDPSEPYNFYPSFTTTIGGFYVFTLVNVPTFNSGVAYQIGDNVCILDSFGNVIFFECISSLAGYTPLATTGWASVWTQVNESQLNEKYSDTQQMVQTCGIKQCISEYQNKLICSLDDICNSSLCDNECLSNYFELQMIEKVIQYGDCWTIDQYRDIMNYVNKVCKTCNCQ